MHRFIARQRSPSAPKRTEMLAGFDAPLDGPVVLFHQVVEAKNILEAGRGRDKHGNELFEYIEGEVGNYPLPAFLKNDTAILSAGKTLRRFHDVTARLVIDGALRLQFGALDPTEVVCHGNFAPYNCVFDCKGKIKGIVDFGGARLGPRSWDLSYAIYRFVPFVDFDGPDDAL